MFTFRSQLFAGDPLLAAIADDVPDADGRPTRISRTQNATGEHVRKVQTALLGWDPAALPEFGADGSYRDETAAAVRRFKIEALAVPAGSVVDDVGPLTVQRLDGIQAGLEAPAATPRIRARVVKVWSRDAEQAFVTIVPAWQYGNQDSVDLPIPAGEMSAWATLLGEDVDLVAERATA